MPDDFVLKGDLAIDTETMGLKTKRDHLCLIQISNGDGNAHLVQFTGKNYQAPNLKKLLSDENTCKIFHFARFDLAAISYYLDVKLNNVFCTKIASRLARTYTDSHGLKELCRELIGVQISKQQQSSDWGSKELSKDQLEYAASDVLYLHELRDKLVGMLNRDGKMHMANACFKFLPTRAEIDLAGFEDWDIFGH